MTNARRNNARNNTARQQQLRQRMVRQVRARMQSARNAMAARNQQANQQANQRATSASGILVAAEIELVIEAWVSRGKGPVGAGVAIKKLQTQILDMLIVISGGEGNGAGWNGAMRRATAVDQALRELAPHVPKGTKIYACSFPGQDMTLFPIAAITTNAEVMHTLCRDSGLINYGGVHQGLTEKLDSYIRMAARQRKDREQGIVRDHLGRVVPPANGNQVCPIHTGELALPDFLTVAK